MRRWFRRLTLRWKLAFVTGMVCAAVLLTAVVSLARFQYVTLVEEEHREIRSLATLIGRNCTGALRFRDEVFAGEILASLVEKPAVRGAILRLPQGEVLASWWRDGKESSIPAGWSVFQQVIHGGDRVLGQIDLLVDIHARNTAALARLIGAAAVVVFGAALVGAGLLFVLERWITRPLGDLTRTAQIVARRGDYAVRAPESDGGEVGELITTFNRMLERIARQDAELQQSRADLLRKVDQLTSEVQQRTAAELNLRRLEAERIELARAAGMAEVAAGVLHNVGNVLNSINVSVGLLDQRIREVDFEGLHRAVRLLEPGTCEVETSPARLAALRDYLAEMVTQLELDRTDWRRELENLRDHVAHVRVIVSRQQEHARTTVRVEPGPIDPVVEDALRLVGPELHRRRVRIEREYPADARAVFDPHALLQILVNLFRNAAAALDPVPEPTRCLRIRYVRRSGVCALEVEDNGVGISPEHLARIFQPGFSTRHGGHGYGLHSSALAAQSMGGRLFAESAGPGAGAVFRLEIPAGDDEASSCG